MVTGQRQSAGILNYFDELTNLSHARKYLILHTNRSWDKK